METKEIIVHQTMLEEKLKKLEKKIEQLDNDLEGTFTY